MVLKKLGLLLSGPVLPVTFAGATVAASFLGRNHAASPTRPDLNSAWVVRGGGSTRVSMSTDAAAEEAAPVNADGETFEFQAEVSRVWTSLSILYQGAWRLLVLSIGRQAGRQARKEGKRRGRKKYRCKYGSRAVGNEIRRARLARRAEEHREDGEAKPAC